MKEYNAPLHRYGLLRISPDVLLGVLANHYKLTTNPPLKELKYISAYWDYIHDSFYIKVEHDSFDVSHTGMQIREFEPEIEVITNE